MTDTNHLREAKNAVVQEPIAHWTIEHTREFRMETYAKAQAHAQIAIAESLEKLLDGINEINYNIRQLAEVTWGR